MFLQLFKLYGFRVTDTCKAVGITRHTFLKWKREDKDFREIMSLTREAAFQSAEVNLSMILSALWEVVELDPMDALEFGMQVQSRIISRDSNDEPIEMEQVVAKLAGIPKHIRRLLQVEFTEKGPRVYFPDKVGAMREISKLHKLYEGGNTGNTTLNLTVVAAPQHLDPAMEVAQDA